MTGEKQILKGIKELIDMSSDNVNDVISNMNALSVLYRNSDDLLRDMRIKYLGFILDSKKEILTIGKDSKPDIYSAQALAYVDLNENTRAWLSVDGAGLYIITNAKPTDTANDWKADHDFWWKRIKKSDGSIITMTDFEILQNKICLDDYLNELNINE